MISPLIERLKRLDYEISAEGLGASSVVVTKPTTVLDFGEHLSSDDYVNVYNVSVYMREVRDVTKDLFASAFYSNAVQEAFKAVDKYVADISGISGQSGASLMRTAFSIKSPVLQWSKRDTTSEKDEHEGYQHMFAGAMLGIRNPTAHEFDWVDEPATALDLIIFAQHLISKLKQATKVVS